MIDEIMSEIVEVSLVLHEDVAEGAVEHRVDEVGQAEVEDEQNQGEQAPVQLLHFSTSKLTPLFLLPESSTDKKLNRVYMSILWT